MRWLRTNTACRVTVGPFLDATDGVTPETAITVTNCHLTAMVDNANVPTLALDANATASGGNNDMVHVTGDDAGFYDLELTAAQLNYLGRMILSINDATTHVPVFHEFMIMPAMIYDSMVLGTDRLDANVTHIGDTAQTARDVGASVLLSSGTGAGQLDITSGVTKSNAVQFAGQAITAAAPVTIPALPASTTNITGGSIGLTSAAVQAIWDALTSALTTTGSIGKRIVDFLTGDAFARIGAAGAGLTALGDTRIANLDATVTSRTKPADTQAAVTTVTNLTNAAGAGDLTAAMKASIKVQVDLALDQILADSVPADGTRPNARQALYMIVQYLTERVVTSTTVTVNKPNGDSLYTLTTNDPSSPTSISRTA